MKNLKARSFECDIHLVTWIVGYVYGGCKYRYSTKSPGHVLCKILSTVIAFRFRQVDPTSNNLRPQLLPYSILPM